MLTTIEISDLSVLRQYVQKFVSGLKAPHLILLQGPMGAGKTEFVKMVCHCFGIATSSSPSFAIHNEYQGRDIRIHHFDLYRLKDEDEVESVGFWDIFSDKKALIFVEWPERVNCDQLPLDWPQTVIRIEKLPGERRRLQVQEKS